MKSILTLTLISLFLMTPAYGRGFSGGSFHSSRSFGGSFSRPSTSFSRSLSVRPTPSLPKATSVPSFPKAATSPKIAPTPTIAVAPRVTPPTSLYRVKPLYSTAPGYAYHDYYYHPPIYQTSSPSWFDIFFWSWMFNRPNTVQSAPTARCGDGTYLDKNNTCQQLPKCGVNQRLTKDMVCEVYEEPKKADLSPLPSGDQAKSNWEKALTFDPK